MRSDAVTSLQVAMNVGWWCSAQQGPWTWSPQYFPGIWIAMIALLAGYVYALRRIGPSKVGPGERVVTRSQVLSFAAGWLLLWVGTDWPLGVLGAGYLLSAHMIQYLLYSLVVAPLLIQGAPLWMRQAVIEARGMVWVRFFVNRPLYAFALFNVVLAITHMPFIADTLKPIQFGSMAMDTLWLLAALIFWTSIGERAGQEETTATDAKRVLYVIGITVLPTIPGAFFVYADFPIYTTFEFATRVFEGFSAKDDQVLAGLLMWVGMMPILMLRLALAFFGWSQTEAKRAGQI
jgi:putative membrane protein